MKITFNKFNNYFINEFDKNHKPIFINDKCKYITKLGNEYIFHYIGDNKYMLDNDDNIYKLNSLSGNPSSKDIETLDNENNYYIVCYFDTMNDLLLGIMKVSNDFNEAYQYFNEGILSHQKEIDELPVFKEFIYQKLFKVKL